MKRRRPAVVEDSPKILGLGEAATMLGLPHSEVVDLVRSGHLPAFREGHYLRFRMSTVETVAMSLASSNGRLGGGQ